MSALALKAYRSAAVDVRCTDADKRDLVIMMYDGAIEAIRLARAHAERTERRAVSSAVSRALAILNGLRETLDVQKGGSVASHLVRALQRMPRISLSAKIYWVRFVKLGRRSTLQPWGRSTSVCSSFAPEPRFFFVALM
jgi:flagellar secretion chaperone FliS